MPAIPWYANAIEHLRKIIQPSSKADEPRHPPFSILLVDDMEADIELTRIVFDIARLHCNFHVAHSGRDAFAMLKHGFTCGDVDVLLIDINMPGMNGFELLERVKADADTKHLPVVLCTGSMYERDRVKAKALGALGYITKPTSMPAIQTMLNEIPMMRRMDTMPRRAA